MNRIRRLNRKPLVPLRNPLKPKLDVILYYLDPSLNVLAGVSILEGLICRVDVLVSVADGGRRCVLMSRREIAELIADVRSNVIGDADVNWDERDDVIARDVLKILLRDLCLAESPCESWVDALPVRTSAISLASNSERKCKGANPVLAEISTMLLSP